MKPLWTPADLIAAAAGTADGLPSAVITGISLDSRGLAPGDVFVALKDQRDGHDFVTAAFANGAAAALVTHDYARRDGDGALIRVPDTLRALEAIGRAARARLAPDARVIAVTGSAGKTGTKEMLRACCSRLGATHAADKSFNNHWGVPLTLARMPSATCYGIFEIGMNHAGEITPLSQLVRPHVAIITTVEAVHLEQFASVADIAEAKAEIFAGLTPNSGVAILNRDNPHFLLLLKRATERGIRVVSFGHHSEADVHCTDLVLGPEGSRITARTAEFTATYSVSIPGAHIAQNSLAALAALQTVGAAESAIAALADLQPPAGRGTHTQLTVPGGAILLIDESYNANPASMRAALSVLATIPRDRYARRIAVLGDMLELGNDAPALHAGLKEAVDAAGADLVFACGPHMARLFEALPAHRQGAWAAASSGIEQALLNVVAAGDAIMVKGSNGSRMAPLVAAMKARFAG